MPTVMRPALVLRRGLGTSQTTSAMIVCSRLVIPRKNASLPLSRRSLHSSQSLRSPPSSQPQPQSNATPLSSLPPFYTGPLANTFRSLKLFSLSSLGLITSLSPILFLVEAPIPVSARAAMAGTAILASTASTALVGWCGAPYVGAMRRLPSTTSTGSGSEASEDRGAVQMTTKTLFLNDLHTQIYDPVVLGPTNRLFATWELQSEVRSSPSSSSTVGGGSRVAGTEEVLARTLDARGNTRGEWVIKWEADSDGSLIGRGSARGKPLRHFNIHEELLSDTTSAASTTTST